MQLRKEHVSLKASLKSKTNENMEIHKEVLYFIYFGLFIQLIWSKLINIASGTWSHREVYARSVFNKRRGYRSLLPPVLLLITTLLFSFDLAFVAIDRHF